MNGLKQFLGGTILLLFCLSVSFSCEEVLFEADISDARVNLLAPSAGSELNFTSIRFNWSSLEGASGYKFQLATPNFNNADQIIEDIELDSITEYSVQLNENNYEWRVSAFNSAYETAYSSSEFSVVDNSDFSDNRVIILSPVDNTVTNVLEQVIQWEPIEDAESYRVEITDEASALVDEIETSESEVPYMFSDGAFIVKVKAINAEESTLYSSVNISTDTQAPNMPELVTPINEAVLNDENINFTWTRNPIQGSVEFDSLFLYNDAGLTNLILKERSLNNSLDEVLSNDSYFWLVKSYDEAGNIGEESSIFSFVLN